MASITQYSSMLFTGSAPAKPDGLGDVYLEQDRVRDFAWVWDRVGALAADLAGAGVAIVSGGSVVQGADVNHINVAAAVGYAPYAITLGTDNGNPPASGSEDVSSVRIAMAAQNALALTGVNTGTVYQQGTAVGQVVTGATLDGVTVNYVKLEYAEGLGLNRQRLRAAGTYYFTRTPQWRLTVNSTAPTAYQVLLATLVGNGSTALSIVNQFSLPGGRKGQVMLATTPLSMLVLPATPRQGDIVEIAAEAYCKLVQNHSEHVISYRNWLFTTKGVNGYVQFKAGDRARLLYRGAGFLPQAPAKIADPGTLPTGTGGGSAWSPNGGRYLAIAHDVTPFITIYDWITGSPVKISNPATLPVGQGFRCAWSPDERYLAVVHLTTPFVTIYDWTSGAPVKIADPASLPTGIGFDAAWSPDSRYLAIGHGTSRFITIYDMSTGTPVKITDPGTLPASTGNGVAWSPDGRWLGVAHSVTPFMTVYDWISGAPVKIADPASLPASAGNGFVWSPEGRFSTVAHNGTPFLSIYDWSSGLPVKVAGNPASLPAGDGKVSVWSPNGRYLTIGHATSRFVTIYDWITGGPVKIADPGTLPTGQGNGAAWSPDGRYLAIAHAITPFVTIYDTYVAAGEIWLAEFASKGPWHDDDFRFRFK